MSSGHNIIHLFAAEHARSDSCWCSPHSRGLTGDGQERVTFAKLTAAFFLALVWLAPTASLARENLALDKYTCANFLRDMAKPDNGSKVLKSMMMISWATGYASGAWEDFARADASAFAKMAGVLGAACRKHPKQRAARVIARLVRESSRTGASVRAAPIFSGKSLVTDMQKQLDRVGCDPGSIDGQWGNHTKQALERFSQYAKLSLPAKIPTMQAFFALKDANKDVCPGGSRPATQTTRDRGLRSVIKCCLAYCRIVHCNSPPASLGCSAGFTRMEARKYGAAFRSSYGGDTYTAMKRNYFQNGVSAAGVQIPQCR